MMTTLLTTQLSSASTVESILKLPDPTLPAATRPSSAARSATNLRLQSIIHSGQRKSAVINGYIKTIGSRVDGGHVIDIKHDTVIISRDGRHYTLRLPHTTSVKHRGAKQ